MKFDSGSNGLFARISGQEDYFMVLSNISKQGVYKNELGFEYGKHLLLLYSYSLRPNRVYF